MTDAEGGESSDGEQTAPRDERVLDCLGDEVCRDILAAGAGRSRSASALADQCGVSRSTVYRRLNRLVDLGLVEELARTDRTARAGSSVFRTTTDTLQVLVESEGLQVQGYGDQSPSVEGAPPTASDVRTQVVEGEDGPYVEVRFRLPADRLEDLFTPLRGETATSDASDSGSDAEDREASTLPPW